MFHQRKAPGLKREWDMGQPERVPKTPAAPATVKRRAGFQLATAPGSGWEGESPHRPASQETGLARVQHVAVGCDGRENNYVDDNFDETCLRKTRHRGAGAGFVCGAAGRPFAVCGRPRAIGCLA